MRAATPAPGIVMKTAPSVVSLDGQRLAGQGAETAPAPKPTEGALYGLLRNDLTVSDGAFRLWHVLRGYCGSKGYTWHGQRQLAKRHHWSIHSLKPWIKQLVDGGYLRVEKPDRTQFPFVPAGYKGVVYTPASTVAETGHSESTVAQTGHSESTVAETGPSPCPETTTATVSSIGNEIKQRELSKGMKRGECGAAGAAPPSPPTESRGSDKNLHLAAGVVAALARLVPDWKQNERYWLKCVREDPVMMAECLDRLGVRMANTELPAVETPGAWLRRVWDLKGGDLE